MNYIIDTHIFLWLIFDHKKIPQDKLDVLENPNNIIHITSISFWEISLKFNLGKLELKGVNPEELPTIAREMDLTIIDIDSNTMSSFYKLKKITHHKDPFDRLIIWQCISNKYPLISQDNKFDQYSELGLSFI